MAFKYIKEAKWQGLKGYTSQYIKMTITAKGSVWQAENYDLFLVLSLTTRQHIDIDSNNFPTKEPFVIDGCG